MEPPSKSMSPLSGTGSMRKWLAHGGNMDCVMVWPCYSSNYNLLIIKKYILFYNKTIHVCWFTFKMNLNK